MCYSPLATGFGSVGSGASVSDRSTRRAISRPPEARLPIRRRDSRPAANPVPTRGVCEGHEDQHSSTEEGGGREGCRPETPYPGLLSWCPDRGSVHIRQQGRDAHKCNLNDVSVVGATEDLFTPRGDRTPPIRSGRVRRPVSATSTRSPAVHGHLFSTQYKHLIKIQRAIRGNG